MNAPTTPDGSGVLELRRGQTWWSREQLAALNHIGLRDASDVDRLVFLNYCQRTGLDPFARQIYMIGRNTKRWDPDARKEVWEKKWTIQTAIDGFRVIARRAVDKAGGTLGYEDTLWCGADGKWVDVWLGTEPPAAAKVTVLRGGQRYPAIALFEEYKQTNKDGSLTQMWEQRGASQLAKCAETLALRKACPQDLSGIYSDDEMDQAGGEHRIVQTQQFDAPAANRAIEHAVQREPGIDDELRAAGLNPAPSPEPPPEVRDEIDAEHEGKWPTPLRTEPQSKNIHRLLKKIGEPTRDEALAQMSGWIGRELLSTKDLTVPEAIKVIDELKVMAGEEVEHINTVTGEVT